MGWEVDDVTAYRTVRAAPPAADVREAIKSGAFDAVRLHVELHGAQPRRHRRQAAPDTPSSRASARHGQDGRGARPAGRRPGARGLGRGPRRRARRPRRAARAGARRRQASRCGGPASGRHASTAQGSVMAGPAVAAPPAAQSPAIRRLVAETRLHPADLVLPVFVREGATEPAPISSMPGVVQHTLESLVALRARRRAPASAGSWSSACPRSSDAHGLRRRRPRRHPQRRAARGACGGRRRPGRSWPTCASTSSPTTVTAGCSTRTAGSTTTPRWSATPRWRWPRPRAGAHVLGLAG